MRLAHSYKTFALCKLSRWEEAKSYAENVVLSSHPSIQRLMAFPCADIPIPDNAEKLQLKHRACSGVVGIEADRAAISGIILGMGSDLAFPYVNALKNIDLSKNHYSDVISLIQKVLSTVGWVTGSDSSWGWVRAAINNLKDIMDYKLTADEKFRSGEYQESIILYSEAIKIDPEACLWNAILYCNRAAAYMNLGKYNDAINDCNLSWSCDVHNQLCLLLRARSWKAVGQTLFSIRDYRKYLSKKLILSSSSSEKVDSEEIDRELDDFIESECEKILSNQIRASSSVFTSASSDENVSIENLQEVHFILIYFFYFFKVSF